MNLHQLAARISELGGSVESHFTMARNDGTRLSVWGDELSAAQFSMLLSLVQHGVHPTSADARARARAHFVHDESIRRRR